MLRFVFACLLFTIVYSLDTNCSTSNPFNQCKLKGSMCVELNDTWYCILREAQSICGVEDHSVDPQFPLNANYQVDRSDDTFHACFYKWYYGITVGSSIDEFCTFYDEPSADCMAKNRYSACYNVVYHTNLVAQILANNKCPPNKHCACNCTCPCENGAVGIVENRNFNFSIILSVFLLICIFDFVN